jgi:hypothetical protein
MAKYALLIHGISHFDEISAVSAAQKELATHGYSPNNVRAFNWDLIVGDPEAGSEGPFNLRFLAEIGAGLLESAHLGFFIAGFQGRSKVALRIHNLMALVLQLLAILLPLWLTIAAFRHQINVVFCTLIAIVTTLLLLTVASMRRGFMCACIRRCVLVLLWPLSYVVTLPIFVPGLLLLWLTFVAMFSRFGVLSSSVEPTNILHFLQGFAAIVVTAGIPIFIVLLFLNLLPLLPIGVVAKLVADVVRYIGLPSYRSALLNELSETIRKLDLDQNAEILLMTHSLGTAIAVDYLAQLPTEIRSAGTIHLVTMGSPLKRYFARFWPGFYPCPADFAAFFTGNLPNFRWVNVFRPRDPIGACLGGQATTVSDQPVDRNLSWFAAHFNYFSSSSVYTSVFKALNEPGQSLSLTETLIRLQATPGANEDSVGWSSGSFFSSLWSKRKRALDFVSELLPPFGWRHLLLILALAVGTIIWIQHQEDVYVQRVAVATLNREPFPTRGFPGWWRWNDIELEIVFAPVLWAFVLNPFLRLALVSVNSYPPTPRRNRQEELEMRGQVRHFIYSRIRSLSKPAIVLAIFSIFLVATHYWK